MTAFLSVVLALYLAVNAYLLARLCATLKRTGVIRALACALLLFFALAFPASRLLGGRLPHALAAFLSVAGSLYLAPMIYGFFFALFADLLRCLNGFIAITPLPPPFSVKGRLRAVLAVVTLALLVSAAGALNARFPHAVRHDVTIRAPERAPLKIVVISDTHLGRLVGLRHMQKIVNLVNGENADLVLLAGDIMDDLDWMDDEENRARGVELFAGIRSRLGTWAVAGNHDHYAGIDAAAAFLADAGVRLLRDEWAVPGGEILLVGREDRTVLQRGGTRKPLADLAADARDARFDFARLPLVVMDHQPFDLREAEDADAALQLSGHTHRGQFFPFNLVVSKLYERHYGLYKRGNTNYYVSSGAGTWGPPIRTSGRPEVVVVTMHFRE